MEEETIGQLVRRLENNFVSGTVKPSKYVNFSLSEDINKIYAYRDSKHTSGEFDSLGREKPFFNICIASRNIWYRATDIDRKNIRVKATKSSNVLTSFIATAKLQEWMRKENFGEFLNKWGMNSADFNESILEFVEQGDRLIPSVLTWNKIIVDPIDVDNNPIIKVLELTEAQLYKNKSYDKKKIEELCEAKQSRETTTRDKQDNKSDYIKLYEIHGEFSEAQYRSAKGLEIREGDDDTYSQQMYVVSYVQKKKVGEYDDFVLFCGKEKKPHMLTALLPEIDGSIALKGSIKNLFDAQWMTNHSAKAIKDILDLASKMFFQTSDGSLVGQNALNNIETGDILIHALNQPITQVNNGSHDISSLQSYGSMWKSLGNEINGISESMLGINPPSGTAWRQTEALLGESHSLFELMTENKRLSMEKMLRTYVLPFIKKQLNNKDEIVATLNDYGIDKIESIFLKKEATKRAIQNDIQSILHGGIPTQDVGGAMSDIQSEMDVLGGQRFFKPSEIDSKTWKDIFKDFEWDVEVVVEGENVDQDAVTTLNTLLQTIARNPMILQDENMKKIVIKILEMTNVMSPLELSKPSVPTPIAGAVGGNNGQVTQQ